MKKRIHLLSKLFHTLKANWCINAFYRKKKWEKDFFSNFFGFILKFLLKFEKGTFSQKSKIFSKIFEWSQNKEIEVQKENKSQNSSAIPKNF